MHKMEESGICVRIINQVLSGDIEKLWLFSFNSTSHCIDCID